MELLEDTPTGVVDAVLTNDGQGIAFTLQGPRGPLTRLRFTLDEMPGFIAHLCHVVQALHPEPRPAMELQNQIVPVAGVGLAGSFDPTRTLLVARLAGMDLAFELASTSAASLADGLEQMALNLRTLSAATAPQ